MEEKTVQREDVLVKPYAFSKLKVLPTPRWKWSPNASLTRSLTSNASGPIVKRCCTMRCVTSVIRLMPGAVSCCSTTLTPEQKLLARYGALTQCVSNHRYPGCLFIAACTFYPDPQHPIHQLAEQQKQASLANTHELLTQLEVDDPAMVAKQMELIVEGCLSRLLIKRSQADVDTAQRLAEDILRFAQCRAGGALT
jgi:hypothetical protein